MDVNQAYNLWASQYDTNINKTRDLEAMALRQTLAELNFNTCLEIGCGTGKNTDYLITKSKEILAIDLSKEMLAKAKEKINSERVIFQQADINLPWVFASKQFDLIVFSLVLEHIENLDAVFEQASNSLVRGGYIYIGELHPFKQYSGTKARFETENGEQVVTCFNHHISDFILAAKKHGFEIADINEYFDDKQRKELPRILMILMKKI
jgi:predicted TPR repeat methyltransferase